MGRAAHFFRRFGEEGPSRFFEYLLLVLLIPFAYLYGIISKIRVSLYLIGLIPSFRPSVPVISVGNLTVGGTGKTPVVDFIVKRLIAKGRKVAVVSRGYGGEGGDHALVVRAGGDILLPPRVCGDEPYLLARRNPEAIVIVSPRRRDGVLVATRDFGANVVILDDGFQHLRVRRDLDIVLLDSSRPFGNGHVLPAGVLREFPSALRRSDLVILTRDAGNPLPAGIDKPVFRSTHILSSTIRSLPGEMCSIEHLVSGKCFAFAGIASPVRFFDTIGALGVTLSGTMPLPDHVLYDSETVARINTAAHGCDFMVTTEKDGVKLQGVNFDMPCYEIPMDIDFFDECGFCAEIDKVIS